MDDTHQDLSATRRNEQLERLQRHVREVIIDTAIHQLQSEQLPSPAIWLADHPERPTDALSSH